MGFKIFSIEKWTKKREMLFLVTENWIKSKNKAKEKKRTSDRNNSTANREFKQIRGIYVNYNKEM